MDDFCVPPAGSDRVLGVVSDDELTALAMAADPAAPLDANAMAWLGVADGVARLLPEWYMPRPIAARRGRATQIVVVSLVAGFLMINALGLCVTSGFISLA